MESVNSGSPLVPLAGGVVGIVVGLLILRWIIGAVWGTIRFGLTIALVLGVVYVIARLWRGSRATT